MPVTRFSVMCSKVFMALFIWVVCLAEERITVRPTKTVVYNSTEMTMIANTSAAGEYNSSIVCGNDTEKCLEFCSICQFSFEGKIMQCLSLLVTHVCVLNFEDQMNSLKNTDWCIWHNVNSLYSNISICTEDISDCLMIPWPNALVEQIFVDIHSRYFKDCPSEELRDPSPATVFALVITPICLIPIMVSLVVLKTKNGDGSSS